MRGAVDVDHGGPGLAGDQHPRCGVPGLVAEDDAGVQATLGDPGQVQRGGAEHADTVHRWGELDGDGQAGLVLAVSSRAGGVVAYRDYGIPQPGRTADRQPGRPRISALANSGVIRLAQERRVDHPEDRLTVMQQGQGGHAQRDVVGVVRRPVDRVQRPYPPRSRGGGAALFLAEKANARSRLRQVGPHSTLDRHINVGHKVPVLLLRDGGRPPGPHHVAGQGGSLHCNRQK